MYQKSVIKQKGISIEFWSLSLEQNYISLNICTHFESPDTLLIPNYRLGENLGQRENPLTLKKARQLKEKFSHAETYQMSESMLHRNEMRLPQLHR